MSHNCEAVLMKAGLGVSVATCLLPVLFVGCGEANVSGPELTATATSERSASKGPSHEMRISVDSEGQTVAIQTVRIRKPSGLPVIAKSDAAS